MGWVFQGPQHGTKQDQVFGPYQAASLRVWLVAWLGRSLVAWSGQFLCHWASTTLACWLPDLVRGCKVWGGREAVEEAPSLAGCVFQGAGRVKEAPYLVRWASTRLRPDHQLGQNLGGSWVAWLDVGGVVAGWVARI